MLACMKQLYSSDSLARTPQHRLFPNRLQSNLTALLSSWALLNGLSSPFVRADICCCIQPDIRLDPCHAAGAAESTSIKAVQDAVPTQSSNHLTHDHEDPITSAITSDIQTDLQASTQPQPSHGAAAAAATASSSEPNTSGHQESTTAGRTALGKDLSGDHSTVVAESISPRYSSQQSQGTNIDWEEAAAQGEVSSRQTQLEAQASPNQAANTQQPNSTAGPQPGTLEHHIANQNLDEYTHFLGEVHQGKVQLDPAKHPKPAFPSWSQKLTSQSSQRARAFADDVKGMAPNPGSSMVGEEGGGRPWLKRAFSMVDQENMGIDMESQMNSLDKVESHLHAVSLNYSEELGVCCVRAVIT